MVCSRCGFSNNGLLNSYICPACGGIISSESKVVNKTSVSKSQWESEFSKDYPFSSFINTVKALFFKPDQLYKTILPSQNATAAWLFALIAGSIGFLFVFLWSHLFTDQLSEIYDETDVLIDFQESSLSQKLLFTPLLLTIQILLISLYTQIMLFIARTRKLSWKSTFKIVAYSQGAMIFQIIPAIGTFLTSIMMFYFVITGIHQIYNCSKFKAFFYLLFPIVLIGALFAFALVLIFISGITATEYLNSLLPFFK